MIRGLARPLGLPIAPHSAEAHWFRDFDASESVAPAGYAIAFDAAEYTLGDDADVVSVMVSGAHPLGTYALTISSDGGGSDVTDTGSISGSSFQITGLDCSGLTAGTLTASIVLTDQSGNEGDAATDTATLNASA